MVSKKLLGEVGSNSSTEQNLAAPGTCPLSRLECLN